MARLIAKHVTPDGIWRHLGLCIAMQFAQIAVATNAGFIEEMLVVLYKDIWEDYLGVCMLLHVTWLTHLQLWEIDFDEPLSWAGQCWIGWIWKHCKVVEEKEEEEESELRWWENIGASLGASFAWVYYAKCKLWLDYALVNYIKLCQGTFPSVPSCPTQVASLPASFSPSSFSVFFVTLLTSFAFCN